MNDASDPSSSADPAVTSNPVPELSLDAILEVLANHHRRYALYTLIEACDDIVSLQTLIEEVATLAIAVDGEAFTHDRYQDIAADLYHWHLPVLSEVGLIDCDPRQETIRYVGHPKLESWTKRVQADELR